MFTSNRPSILIAKHLMVTTKVMQLMNKGEMFWIERENCYCGVEVLVVENRVELGAIDIIVSCLKNKL